MRYEKCQKNMCSWGFLQELYPFHCECRYLDLEAHGQDRCRRKHILVFVVVKQTVNTAATIDTIVKTENADTNVVVRCVFQHGYSLIKILFNLRTMKIQVKNIQRCWIHCSDLLLFDVNNSNCV